MKRFSFLLLFIFPMKLLISAHFSVTNNASSGAGSLPDAFQQSNASSDTQNQITVDPGAGEINLPSVLPNMVIATGRKTTISGGTFKGTGNLDFRNSSPPLVDRVGAPPPVGTLEFFPTGSDISGSWLVYGDSELVLQTNIIAPTGTIALEQIGRLSLKNNLEIETPIQSNDEGIINVLSGSTTRLVGGTKGSGYLLLEGGGTFIYPANTHIADGGIGIVQGTLEAEGGGSNYSFINSGIDFIGRNNVDNTATLHITDTTSQSAGLRLIAGPDSAPDFLVIGIVDVDVGKIFTVNGRVFHATSKFGTLEKQGLGKLILTNTSNNYNRGTTISQGILEISSDSNLGGGGDLVFGSGTLHTTASLTLPSTRPVTTNTSATLDVDNNTTLTLSGQVKGGGSLIKTGLGNLVLTDNTSNYTGGTSINSGTVEISSDGNLGAPAGEITVDGGTLHVTTISVVSNRNMNMGTGGATFDTDELIQYKLDGNISGAGNTITKKGKGTLALSGTNQYKKTEVQEGMLAISNINNIGDGELTLNGGILHTIGDISGPLSLTLTEKGGTALVDGSTTCAFNQPVSMTGATTSFHKRGAGNLDLQAANNWSGQMTIQEGTVNLKANGALANNIDVDLGASSAKLDISGANGNREIGNLTGQGIVDVGTNKISLVTSKHDVFAGSFSGNGGIDKQGGQTLEILGDSTGFTGLTEINGGHLLVKGKLPGPINVNFGYFLGGNGTVGSVLNHGTVTPGASIGTLNIVGDFTQGPGGYLQIETDPKGNSDKIIASGNANLDGTLRIVPSIGRYDAGTVYTIYRSSKY